jgi:hypothetical protein
LDDLLAAAFFSGVRADFFAVFLIGFLAAITFS